MTATTTITITTISKLIMIKAMTTIMTTILKSIMIITMSTRISK
jgi:hypothetical protein